VEYAIAAIAALVVGGIVWAFFQGRKSGKDSVKVDIHEDADKRREAGDEIMAEPVADESDWLAEQRRKRVQDAGDGDSV